MTKLNKTNFQIRFRRGLAGDIYTLATSYLGREGMPFWTTDTSKMHVHDGDMPVRVHGLDLILVNNGEIITHDGEVVWDI